MGSSGEWEDWHCGGEIPQRLQARPCVNRVGRFVLGQDKHDYVVKKHVWSKPGNPFFDRV